MEPLSLPPCDLKIERSEDSNRVYDIIRKKYIKLTPEEWVRQHFVHFLINEHNYPKGLISSETGLKYNKLEKRFDLLVLDRTGEPYLLIECKAANVKLDARTVEQLSVYNQVIGAPLICITNGMHTFVWKKTGPSSWEQLADFPKHSE